MLDAEPYKLDNLLVPPPIPGSRFLLGDAFTSSGENARVMPPSSVDERLGVSERSNRWAVPDLLVREGGFKNWAERIISKISRLAQTGERVTYECCRSRRCEWL